jgi:DNA-binding transcriptional LysR family regulator
VRRLTEQFPELQLRITADITPALFERLQRGELDAALALMPARGSASVSIALRANSKQSWLHNSATADDTR